MDQRSKRSTDLPQKKDELLKRLLREKGIGSPQTYTIPHRQKAGPYPLSFAQQRLWFADQIYSTTPLYNIPYVARVEGPLDTRALEFALNAIVRRHEVLRTTFKVVDGQPVQSVAASMEIALRTVDLGTWQLPDRDREVEALRLAQGEICRPFDLERGPLVRAMVVQFAEQSALMALAMHHIVSDGWSDRILMNEIAAFYDAFTTGKAADVSDLPIQYADYALWQQTQIAGEEFDQHLAYWQQHLAGIPPLLELPTDFPRPRVQSFRGSYHALSLPKPLVQKLTALSSGEQASLFMTLLAAFQVLLYRYTGQVDIVVGSPIANRQQPELENLIGFFVNMLALRTNLSGNPTFREVLRQVRSVTLDAYAHQDMPFERLVEALQPERNQAYMPIFQVMFALDNTAPPALTFCGLRLTPIKVDTGASMLDLDIRLRYTAESISGWLHYNTDLFRDDTISRIGEHFLLLLDHLADDPARRIDSIPLLARTEQFQMLVEWNATETSYAADACLHQLFEAQVQRSPRGLAVDASDGRLSYQELNERANQLAHYLQDQGVGADVCVGICLPRSIEMLVAALAVLKAGGACVPLDASYPRERLAFMLDDSRMAALLTNEALLERLPKSQIRYVFLDLQRDAIASASTANPHSAVHPDQLAYIMYTSGSTGRPKGVMLAHRPLTNLIEWHLANLSRGATTLQFASLSFDASFHEMFAAWCSGGALVLASETHRYDIRQLLDLLATRAVRKVMLPVVVLQQIAEACQLLGAAWVGERLAPNLREIITTGEQLQITMPIVELFKQLPDCQLHNFYGPSESHVVTAYMLDSAPSSWPVYPSIGRPIANTQIYILNRELLPVPVGVVGELYIGGICLGRGYLGRPELTAERFVPNPFQTLNEKRETIKEASVERNSAFSVQPLAVGGRLYRTGDLARYAADGTIQFLGRIDHQIKIRGFRIELGEIEEVLRGHPAVRELVLLARDDLPGEKTLVAYIVPTNDQRPTTNDQRPGESDAETQHSTLNTQNSKLLLHPPSSIFDELRAFLAQKLPEYMLPSAFVLLDRMPLTPNGKVDRRALPAPDYGSRQCATTFIAPRTPIEQQLAAIWQELLPVERIGIQDNFFSLGGHSLLVMRMLFKVHQIFQVNVSPTIIFTTNLTLEDLATTILNKQIERVNQDEMLRLLREIDTLSEEEAQHLLGQPN